MPETDSRRWADATPRVSGQPMEQLPLDLYIPTDALAIWLEQFEGPLDLLLYLIRKHNIDILEIPVARVTEQYLEYLALMKSMAIELAAEYLVMAAMLAEIKSRMLLPRPVEADDEEDPRAELIRRLQEYERFKQAAEDIDELPRVERDIHLASVQPPDLKQERPDPDVDLRELLLALSEVLRRADMFTHHHIQRESLSVRERMSQVLSKLEPNKFIEFTTLFTAEEGRLGVVVSFLAVLELLKAHLIELVQAEPFAPIYVSAAGGAQADE